MYIQLITTAVAMQRDMSQRYAAQGRKQEIGTYFLVLNSATASFFERLSPPPVCTEVHAAFLKYLRTGIEALKEEVEAGLPQDSKLARQFVNASKKFALELEALNDAV
jgi:hypothetical protein